MRALLTFWDGGEGHLARIAYLAGLLTKRGHRCTVLSSAAKAARVRELAPGSEIRLLENRPPSNVPARPVTPVYSHAFRHAQRRAALGFTAGFVAGNVAEAGRVIRDVRPELIVNDYHDTVRIAADAAGVPVVSLAMAHGLTSGDTLGAWKVHEQRGHRVPERLDCFNEVRTRLGLPPYADERETFEGTTNLIPTCAELDPVRPRAADVHVGPVMAAPRPAARGGRQRPLVVSYLAEGNNRPESAFPEACARLVAETPEWDFVVLGGERYHRWFSPGASFPGMVPPSDYLTLLDRADAVITHGGTTLVHALERSVPVLCLPWTSSEASWAVRAEEHGAGLLYPAYRRPLEWRTDPAVGADVEVAGHWSIPVTAAGLRNALRRVLDLRTGAAAIAGRLREHRAAAKVVPLLEAAAGG
ncbi:hypothetical protein ABT344_28640 [Micromonospora carbonacea]|uniref:hypothetical protein n=1 Tax=Micromonospora carbonacea TaxID=47853 RepID=UPI0033216406